MAGGVVGGRSRRAGSPSDAVSRATIDDVAAAAGVSVATVSRALRGLPNVAPSTRARVLEAAASLAYVADPAASRLASGATRTIGVIVPMIGPWYYATALAGVEGVVVAAGYDLLPWSTTGPGGLTRFLTAMPFRKRTDGLVVIEAALGSDQLDRVAQVAEHVVAIGHEAPTVSSVYVENRPAARAAVDHLVELGHRRIAAIGGLPDDPFAFQAPLERGAGYREALEAAGLPIDPRLAVGGHFSLAGGAEAMRALLAVDPPPTAVFAMSDEMAIGVLQVARDAGLRVPEDLSVVGFDDHDVATYLGLTTVRQDVQRIGERAAQLLLARLDEGARGVTHEVVPTRLMVRATTARPPPTSA